jgi:hypothetical protein
MKYEITETIETVGWAEGTNNAPAELVQHARRLAEEGKPATFGKIENTTIWVVLSVDDKNNLYTAYRAS